jgi:small-conductance mechanosensitive channel
LRARCGPPPPDPLPARGRGRLVAKRALIRTHLLFLLALLSLAWPAGAWAQDEAAAAQDLRDRLAAAEAIIADPETPLPEIEDLREELRAVRTESAALQSRLEGPRADVRRALDALGAPPAADAPEEPEAVREQREQLDLRAAEIEAAARLASVNIETANGLLDEIREMRSERFFERASEVSASVIQPGTWVEAARGARDAVAFASGAISAWIADRREAGALGYAASVLGVALALAAGISFPLRRFVFRRLDALGASRRLGEDPLGVGAGLKALFHIGAAIASAFILFTAASSQGLLAEPLGALAARVLAAAVFLAIADAVARAWYAPVNPAARLARASDGVARAAWLLVFALAAVAAAGRVIDSAGDALEARSEALDAAAAVEGLAGAVLLFWLVREVGRGAARSESGEAKARLRIPWLRLALLLAAVAAFGAAVGGYGAFARVVVEHTALAVVGVLVFRVVRAFVHGAVFGLIAPRVRKAPSTEEETFSFWTRLVLDAALVLVALPFFALIVGFEPQDILEALERATLGVRIGSFQLSLANLLVAGALFVAALMATRFFQRTLSESVLPRTRMDMGARNSIVALVGYAGLVLGLVLAVSAAGFDLTNIAIIAGALSVGVGLGLQGFVSNFVSGLSLLFERPFKIGDVIVLPPPVGGTGVVRKIGMRATEIETVDRASIIVPNAQLLAAPFTNLTHRDTVGRVVITVPVSHAVDPELVHRLLLDVVKSHPESLSAPAPFVLWKDFGESAFVFEASLHIRDMGRGPAVQNDLRFAIWRALKAHDVEIPYPQRVMHMAAQSDSSEG